MLFFYPPYLLGAPKDIIEEQNYLDQGYSSHKILLQQFTIKDSGLFVSYNSYEEMAEKNNIKSTLNLIQEVKYFGNDKI